LVALIVLPHTLVKGLLVCFWFEFTTKGYVTSGLTY
jgi:hypothetical protein